MRVGLGMVVLVGVLASSTAARADHLLDLALGGADAIGPIPTVTPDVPPRSGPPVVGPSGFPMSSDLDGFYVWLGPIGSATTVRGDWDTLFGGDVTLLRIRERAPLSAAGGSFGFSKFTANEGGRLWLDAILGTRIRDRVMAGVTLGPIVEVAALEHTRVGASIGAWLFTGVTPYVRVGAVNESGAFVELGLHLALPVFRR